jgi:hypothetical protein
VRPLHKRIDPRRARVARTGSAREPSPLSTPQLFRIVVLGDSITFGFGVEEHESHPKVIEVILNEAPLVRGLPNPHEILKSQKNKLHFRQCPIRSIPLS